MQGYSINYGWCLHWVQDLSRRRPRSDPREPNVHCRFRRRGVPRLGHRSPGAHCGFRVGSRGQSYKPGPAGRSTDLVRLRSERERHVDHPSGLLSYDPRGFPTEYSPQEVGVGSGRTGLSFNLDRQVVGVERPDGSTVGFVYDAAGRSSRPLLPPPCPRRYYHGKRPISMKRKQVEPRGCRRCHL